MDLTSGDMWNMIELITECIDYSDDMDCMEGLMHDGYSWQD